MHAWPRQPDPGTLGEWPASVTAGKFMGVQRTKISLNAVDLPGNDPDGDIDLARVRAASAFIAPRCYSNIRTQGLLSMTS